MRILLLTSLFQPEPNFLRGLTFAQALVRQGHEVEVLTGFPQYPKGRIYDGYRQRLWSREILEGIPVIRVPVYPSHDRSGLKRMISYTSLALATMALGPFLIRRPDVIHVYQGNAMLAIPAAVIRLLRRAPVVMDVEDVWPETVTYSGIMIPLPGGKRLLDLFCRFAYHVGDRFIVLSEGYKRILQNFGVPGERIHVVYNWCEEKADQKTTPTVRDEWGLSDAFCFMYAGNMGRMQNLGALLDAVAIIQPQYPQMRLVLVGDGIELEQLKARCRNEQLTSVIFIPRQPMANMPAFFAMAKVLVIHLHDSPFARVGIPQKTQAYMSEGKPVLMGSKGDAAELVRRAGSGIVCEPENPQAIAAAMETYLNLTPEACEAIGRAGKEFYDRELSFQIGFHRVEAIFQDAVKNRQRNAASQIDHRK